MLAEHHFYGSVILNLFICLFVCLFVLPCSTQEVAVKKFLNQDFSGEALLQFKSEVSSKKFYHIHFCLISCKSFFFFQISVFYYKPKVVIIFTVD